LRGLNRCLRDQGEATPGDAGECSPAGCDNRKNKHPSQGKDIQNKRARPGESASSGAV